MRLFLLLFLFTIVTNFSLSSQTLKLGIPTGHTDDVNRVSFSENGKFIVTTSDDNSAIVWDLSSGKILHQIDSIKGALLTNDNKYLITYGLEKVKVFDLASGDQLYEFNARFDSYDHKNDNIHYSSSNGLAAIATSEPSVIVWNIETGKLIHNFDVADKIKELVISHDGQTLYGVSKKGTINIWNIKKGQLVNRFITSDSSYSSVKFSRDHDLLLLQSFKHVSLFRTSTGEKLHELKVEMPEYKGFRSADISPDNRLIVTGSSDGILRVWNLEKMTVNHFDTKDLKLDRAKFNIDGSRIIAQKYMKKNSYIIILDSFKIEKTIPTGEVNISHDIDRYIAFHPEKNMIVEASRDDAVLWDINSGKKIHTLGRNAEEVQYAFFSPKGKYIALMGGGFPEVIEIETGRTILNSDYSFITNDPMVFDENKERVLYSYMGELHIMDLQTGISKKVHKRPENEYISSAHFTKDGNIVTEMMNGKVLMFNESGKELPTYKQQDVLNQKLYTKAIGHNNGLVISSKNNFFMIWNSITGEIVDSFTLNDKIKKAFFTKDDSRAIIFTFKEIYLKDLGTNASPIIISDVAQDIFEVTATADGEYIAITSFSLPPMIYSAKTGKQLTQLQQSDRYFTNTTFSHDGKFIATSSLNNIYIHNAKTGELMQTFNGHTSSVNGLNFSPDNKYLVSCSATEGTMIIWDIEKGQQLFVKRFFKDNEWVVLNNEGHFDASPGAMDLMYWTKGLEVIDFDQLKDRFWIPDLWEKVMKGEKLPATGALNDIKLQPEVKIDSVRNGKAFITLRKRAGGYGEIAIYINGKETAKDARGDKFDTTLSTQSLTVDLADHPYIRNGENKITVKAASADGFLQGRGEETTFLSNLGFAQAPVQFFAVIVGIGSYNNPAIDLKYTVPDAKAISTAVKLGAENLFGAENTYLYTITSDGNERPTKSNIKKAFSEIAKKAKPEDVVMVYLSGHGITWGDYRGDFYFLTADATAAHKEAYNDAALRLNHTINTEELTEWLKASAALKQVMIIDACGSGQAVDNLLAHRDVEASQKKAMDRLKDRTGTFIISGCAADAVSYEASIYGQGLLTYSILQGMKGAALKEDKYVDINTILNHAKDEVPKLAKGIGGIQQPQLLIPKGGSFDIGLLPIETREKIPLADPKLVFIRTTLVEANEYEDLLGLSKAVDEQLSTISAKGTQRSIIFFDAREYPDACKINGAYEQKDGMLHLNYKIRCGNDARSGEIKAKSKEALVEELLKSI